MTREYVQSGSFLIPTPLATSFTVYTHLYTCGMTGRQQNKKMCDVTIGLRRLSDELPCHFKPSMAKSTEDRSASECEEMNGGQGRLLHREPRKPIRNGGTRTECVQRGCFAAMTSCRGETILYSFRLYILFFFFSLLSLASSTRKRFTHVNLLDKLWPQVSSFLLAGYSSFLSRIGFSIPTFQLIMLVDSHRIWPTHALALSPRQLSRKK